MKEKVAIIGMGCVFPGAMDFTEYWQNIVEGKNCIKEVDPDFWKHEEFYDPDPTVPDMSYSKMGGQSGPIEFDTKEFGISPKVMEHTAVEQLFGLVVARQALIDAGYYGKDARPFNREKTGVIMSAGTASHVFSLHCRTQRYNIRKILVNNGIPKEAADLIVEKFLQTQHEWSEDDNPGYIPNVVAGRIANRFDLGGTSCSIDAACGASLGAVKFAVDELVSGNMDIMLCGGANLDNSPVSYLSFTKTPACSKTGKIRPFDADADGMIIGDGVGIMVLKRLADAERDGDKIYAVICGSGSSSDGRAKSIYAPSKEGQVRALNRAYENSSVDMDTIGLIEAHGTGTVAGDTCEIGSVTTAFPDSDKRKTVLGSVKSQVGHMRLAAGIAGCMKVALALHHKVLPNSINMENPNPALIDSRLTVLKKSMPWIINDEQPVRRAGVSAFGFGGTNFHVVLEEYTSEHSGAYRVCPAPVGVAFTADSKDALIAKVEALACAPAAFYADEYRYENAGQGLFRLAFAANTPDEAVEKCNTALELMKKNTADAFTQKGITYNSKQIDGKVTVLFPGQGTQAVNMLSETAINYPEMRAAISKADNVLLKNGETPVSELLYPKALTADEWSEANSAINNTAHTQPVLAAAEAGLYAIMNRRGLNADSFIGHSFGELVALWADGVFDYETLIAMAKKRGTLMSKANPDAAMMACMTDKAKLTEICKDIKNVYIANENSASQTVVSGSVEGIAKLEAKLTDLGIRAVRLKVSGAFHSPYMKEAAAAFGAYLKDVEFGKPSGRVYANATGEKYTDEVADLLEKQLLQPVLFCTEAQKAYEDGSRVFVEVGNGKVLTGLLKDCLSGKEYTAVALCPENGKNSAQQLEFAMAQLFVLGIAVQDDPYRTPHNEDYVPKKSKTTYTVKMKSFLLPKHRAKMDEALLPDQRILDIMKKAQEQKTVVKEVIKEVEVVKEVVNTMETKNTTQAANAYSVNAEVFSKFMDVQTHQMQAASDMLSKVASEKEKENVLNCVTLFQNNSMRALETYFGSYTAAPVTAAVASRPPAEAVPVQTIAPVPAAVPAAAPAPVAAASVPESAVSEEEVSVPIEEPAIKEEVSTVQAPKAAKAAVDVYALITEAIADKTGYPTDMIDEDMELEADLGIDSIKRVEILSMINNSLGGIFTKENVEELSGISMISEMAAYLRTIADAAPSADEVVEAEAEPVVEADLEEQNAPVIEAASGISDEKVIESILLAIADKTGYPEEMIENDMELEADLGIDSIKRVEIFADVLKKLNMSLTPDQTEELSAMATVEDIAGYLSKLV